MSAGWLRQLIEHAPAPIAVLDRDLRYIAVSRRFITDYGLASPEIIGHLHYEVFPEIPERWRAVHQRCLAGASEKAEEEPFPRADGRLDWVRWEVQPWHESSGAIGGIILYTEVITEQVEAREALRKSEEFYQSVLADMPGLICRWRPGGVLTYVNDNYCDFFGRTREELLGRTFMPLIPDEDHVKISEHARALGREFPVGTIVHRAILPGGEVRWLEWVNRCLFDDDGEIREYQSTGHDITDRKRAEDQLHLAQLIIEQSPMVLFRWEVGPGWPMAYCSENVRQWGYSAPDLVAAHRPYKELIHPDDVRRITEEVHRNLASGLSEYWLEYRIVTRAGEARWVHDQTKIERDTNGLPVCAQGIVQDITNLKRSEQALHIQATALEAAANAIVITDRDGVIEWVNPAFLESTGYTLDHAKGKRPADLVSSGQQDQGFYEDLWATILRGEVWRGQVVNRRKDGELRTEEMTITPVRAEHGGISHFIAVKQDITDRLALEEQLHRAQRLESIGQLTGGVAHDFNNILTVVLGNAEMLSEELEGDQRLGPMAEMIAKGAQRGAELTHRLLAFARKQALNPEVVKVNALVSGMGELLQRALGEHVEVQNVFSGALWPALVDAAQLESAVLNLAINARDAMPDGGKLVIEVRNIELDDDYAAREVDVQPGQYVLLAVSDSGCGIAKEDLERVLEPFYTTKEKGKGTGLGLSMVYGFVKQSKGHMKLYSEPGVGTTVKLYLPRSVDDSAIDLPASSMPAPTGGSETVLVVEDDELVRQHAEGQLTALDYRVIVASDGPRAMAIVRQCEDIDLLFTDIVMPGGMNGRQLADAACAIRPGLKVLYTSGYAENAIVHHGRLDPGVHLLGKPYRRSELATKLREALAGDVPGSHES
jgi:PAS domain S-box-containing protein